MEFSFEVNPDLDLAVGAEFVPEDMDLSDEEYVDDFDYSDYDPMVSTGAKPGSDCKVKMLAARYAAGVPLWHDADCYDHGPKDEIVDQEEHEDELDPDLEDLL